MGDEHFHDVILFGMGDAQVSTHQVVDYPYFINLPENSLVLLFLKDLWTLVVQVEIESGMGRVRL